MDWVPIPDDRPLTTAERSLIRWLLEREAVDYLSQLAQARVFARCPCGCPTIDLAVAGVRSAVDASMTILADFQWQAADGAMFGVFVFARGGQLAGLELWSIDGRGNATTLPDPAELRPLDGP